MRDEGISVGKCSHDRIVCSCLAKWNQALYTHTLGVAHRIEYNDNRFARNENNNKGTSQLQTKIIAFDISCAKCIANDV